MSRTQSPCALFRWLLIDPSFLYREGFASDLNDLFPRHFFLFNRSSTVEVRPTDCSDMSPMDVEFQHTSESEVSKPDQANEADVDSKQLESTPSAHISLAAVEKQVKLEYTDDPTTVRPIHGLRWVLTMASLFSFALLYGLDTTIAADIQPAIVKSLGHVQKLA